MDTCQMEHIQQDILDRIHPVVLVGGKSSRFGSDKLLAEVKRKPLVSYPINALREVFGDRVAVVGECDERVRKLADHSVDDPYPGMGPVGGICAALENIKGDLFVCAGDMVAVDAFTIQSLVEASVSQPDSAIYIADDGRVHPTFGLYRSSCRDAFKAAVLNHDLKLTKLIEEIGCQRIKVRTQNIRNINRPEDL